MVEFDLFKPVNVTVIQGDTVKNIPLGAVDSDMGDRYRGQFGQALVAEALQIVLGSIHPSRYKEDWKEGEELPIIKGNIAEIVIHVPLPEDDVHDGEIGAWVVGKEFVA